MSTTRTPAYYFGDLKCVVGIKVNKAYLFWRELGLDEGVALYVREKLSNLASSAVIEPTFCPEYEHLEREQFLSPAIDRWITGYNNFVEKQMKVSTTIASKESFYEHLHNTVASTYANEKRASFNRISDKLDDVVRQSLERTYLTRYPDWAYVKELFYREDLSLREIIAIGIWNNYVEHFYKWDSHDINIVGTLINPDSNYVSPVWDERVLHTYYTVAMNYIKGYLPKEYICGTVLCASPDRVLDLDHLRKEISERDLFMLHLEKLKGKDNV